MKPMKAGSFLALVAVMAAIALFFRYLNSRPENIMNHVILAIRGIREADATGNGAAKEAATKKLNENIDRLKTHLAGLSDKPAEAQVVAAEIVDRLVREKERLLKEDADQPPRKEEPGRPQERRESLNTTQDLLDSLIRDFSRHLPAEKPNAITEKKSEKPQPESASSQEAASTESLSPAEKLVAVVSVVWIGVPLLMWYLNLRRFGFRVLLDVGPMIRYLRGSGNAWYYIFVQANTVLPAMVLIARVWVPDLFLPAPNYCFVLLLCVAAGCMLFLLRPPIILFLTASDRQNKEAIERIKWSLGPWRIVHLLAFDNTPTGTFKDMFGKESEQRSLRQRDGQGWQMVVHELMDHVYVIVLDARVATDAVVAEAKRILSSQTLSRKSVMVVGDNGEQPAVTQAAAEMEGRGSVRLSTSKLGDLARTLTARMDAATSNP